MTIKTSFTFICILLSLSLTSNVIPVYAKQVDSQCFLEFSSEGNIDYLIITTKVFREEVRPILTWKIQKGLSADLKTVEEIQSKYSGKNLGEKIKNCIKDYFENNGTKWVLLAGDHPQVPSQYVEAVEDYPQDGDVVNCDFYYTDLDNNWDLNDDGIYGSDVDEYDYHPEVYIGRIPANNEYEMKKQILKTINYEKKPRVGEWMKRALFAGAITYFDMDWNGDNIVDFEELDGNRFNHFINNSHFAGWNETFLAQTQGIKGSDYYSDEQLNGPNLQSMIKEGINTCNVFAHGNPTSFGAHAWMVDHDGDLLFDYTACPFNESGEAIDGKLFYTLLSVHNMDVYPVDERFGFYYLGSCSTGTFDGDSDCLAEGLLKNIAIGVIASSYVTWGEDAWYERDHGGWFTEGLAFRFWEQFRISNHPGEAFALAKEDYIADREVSSEPRVHSDWEQKVLKQYNLFCDPEVSIWTQIPLHLNASKTQVNEENFTMQVTAGGELVKNATVTLEKEGKLLWMNHTNINGEVFIPISNNSLKGITITFSKDGYIPWQENHPGDSIPVIPGYNHLVFLPILMTVIFVGFLIKSRLEIHN
jgi:hypothetical protein